MIVFPILATAVSLAFGVHLLVRFVRRGAFHEGVWALAMLMFAGASAALALGVQDGWTSGRFRVYWVLGVMTVPYLAQGELYLLTRPRWWIGHLGLAALLVGTALAVGETRSAPISPAALQESFPSGRDVLGEGTPAHRLSALYVWPAYIFLLLGTVWSAYRMKGRDELRRQFGGVSLIAVGATVVAAGTGVGGVTGNFALFSVALALGAAVMYWGFLLATRTPRAPGAPQPPAR